MSILRILLAGCLGILLSCGGTQEAIVVAPPVDFEEETLDTMVVTASPLPEGGAAEIEEAKKEIPQTLPLYNPAAPRLVDLIHTHLALRFDWENQHVLGLATLELTPYFYPQEQVTLDAKDMDIHRVQANGQVAEYQYNGEKLTIQLERVYSRDEKINLLIDYTAKPNEGPEGGSAAITSDKGLFFIDPLDEDPNKPSQIWTQGETENNSKWFPTIDKPNERTTQEIAITVDEKYATLSNGIMTSSEIHNNGTRTDTWVMDQPHAPYLFMLGIGEYAIVKEFWKDIEVSYYVEPAYEPFAAQIFEHTPEMLTFFSDLLDYPYPWQKYSQIICKDYVSGAMENTTAVIFGDFVQKTNRELIDNDNDYIVAHEMFHHWFGDLVTCESWSNLTLQEGFANYSEYLWYEYKDGKDRADAHRQNEMQGYLLSAANQGTHPLIWYNYNNKEEMFDAHSYNKGGLVLHMMRRLIGDEAFFTSLSKYLKDNKYTAVEVDELRMAFEDVTGLDLKWFFDQWYLSEGHPELDVSYSYDTDTRLLKIDVDQIQDIENHLPIYRLEVNMAVYDQDGKQTIYPLVIDQRSQGFMIEDIDRPSVVILDGDDSQLAVINEDKSDEELWAQLQFSPNYVDKISAAQALKSSTLFDLAIPQLLNENHHSLRQIAVDAISIQRDSTLLETVKDIVINDPHSAVKNSALQALYQYDYEMASPYFQSILSTESPYNLVATSLSAMKSQDIDGALKYAELYKDVNSGSIVSTLADIFGRHGNDSHLSYFEDKFSSVSIFSMFNFYNKYFNLLKNQGADRKLIAAQKLADVSRNGDNIFRKFVATSTINKIKNSFGATETEAEMEVRALLKKIIERENDPGLVARYRSF